MALTDSLVSYWKLDEASGNALDAHGSNPLTDGNTVGAATGKINGGRDFEATDSEYFSHADNADLSVGDIDFTFNLWLKLESTGANLFPIGKYGGTNREYRLGLLSTNRFTFAVTSDGTSGSEVSVNANTFGAPSTGTWYMLTCWHDSVNNQLGIAVNAGTPDTTSHSAGVFNGTSTFVMGAQAIGDLHFDGVLDEVGFWKRVLTSDERTQLYNSGNGLAYPFSGSSPSSSPSTSVSSSPSTSPSSSPSASASSSPSSSPSSTPSASVSASPSASVSSSPSASASTSPSTSASGSPSSTPSSSPSSSVSSTPSASPSSSPSTSPSASASSTPSASASSSPSASPSPSASVSASPSTSPSGIAATITIEGNVFSQEAGGINVSSNRLIQFEMTNSDDVVLTFEETRVT